MIVSREAPSEVINRRLHELIQSGMNGQVARHHAVCEFFDSQWQSSEVPSEAGCVPLLRMFRSPDGVARHIHEPALNTAECPLCFPSRSIQPPDAPSGAPPAVPATGANGPPPPSAWSINGLRDIARRIWGEKLVDSGRQSASGDEALNDLRKLALSAGIHLSVLNRLAMNGWTRAELELWFGKAILKLIHASDWLGLEPEACVKLALKNALRRD